MAASRGLLISLKKRSSPSVTPGWSANRTLLS
jgi:hypothetical protein